MKASELRLTNIVLLDGIETEIGITQICNFSFWEKHEQEFCPNRWEGIPLTEEWLLKFGIDLNKGCYFLPLQLVLYKGRYLMGVEDNEYGMEYDECVHIEYVHQLQNLVFALTGREL